MVFTTTRTVVTIAIYRYETMNEDELFISVECTFFSAEDLRPTVIVMSPSSMPLPPPKTRTDPFLSRKTVKAPSNLFSPSPPLLFHSKPTVNHEIVKTFRQLFIIFLVLI